MIVDFFSRQQQAKQATSRLLIYFVLAVLVIFIGVNVLLYLVALVTTYDTGEGTWFWHGWSKQALWGTLWLVAGGSALEWFLLRTGGKAVATMVGAQAVDFATTDASQRQFINVCEEMAIASGMTVPALYILEREQSINAFVAGYHPQDSVLIVTQGALNHLNRDELQAVMGHEFSHILNGDMRLNTYMLSLLAGMLAVGQVGAFLMRSPTTHGRLKKYTIFWPFGLGMYLVGYMGLLIGRLIKAAISRERENLADAASIQFTRNPDALAGALYKIGQQGSQLDNWHAEQISHMCFGDSLVFSQWFSSHPPLEQRINAIAPQFLLRMKYQPKAKQAHINVASSLSAANVMAFSSPLLVQDISNEADVIKSLDAKQDIIFNAPLVNKMRELDWADLQSAQYLHRSLSVEVSRALQSTTGAKAVLFALIAQEQQASLATLESFFGQQTAFIHWVAQLQHALACADRRLALPIVELALSRLAKLSDAEGQAFLVELRRLVWFNQQLSVFEFALLKLIEQQLQKPPIIFKQHTLHHLAQPCAHLIATLLQYSAHSVEQRPVVYQQLLQAHVAPIPPMPSPEQCHLKNLDKVLRQLSYLNLKAKQQVIDVAAATIQSDGVLHRAEYELLRVLAALLACPMPLLAGTIKH